MILKDKNHHNILYESISGNDISGQSKILSSQGKTLPRAAIHTARQEYKLHQHD